MPELVDKAGLSRTKMLPRKKNPMSRPSQRKLTKNTDHQTVPRFEQLADLGFVRKQGPGFDDKDSRRRWRWLPTEPCAWWRDATEGRELDQTFLWHHFASAIGSTLAAPTVGAKDLAPARIAHQTWSAYRVVRRTVGGTPSDSVALFAMIEALASGQLLEMHEVHDLLLAVKRSGCASDDAFFAGGNALDEMFIRLRPGFADAVQQQAEAVAAAWPGADD